jgi:nucleotide-binding universal stress UspA family protein
MTGSGSVVVGVDGTDASRRAVRWAAEEADARGVALRIVHAIDPSDAAGCCVVGDSRTSAAVLGILRDARSVALLAAPDVDIVTESVVRAPAAALVDASNEPGLVCVGSAGESVPHPGRRASLVTELLLTAPCPVVVVRDSWSHRGSVLTATGGGPRSADLFRAAVAEARLHSSPLRILTGADESLSGTPSAHDDVYRRVLADVERCRRSSPDLDVIAVPPLWTAAQYLSRYRGRIALFIAPSRLTHDIGTVIHPDAVRALAVLDCPVMFNADLGCSVPSGEAVTRVVAS